MRDSKDGECRVCGEFLESMAERQVGVHIGCVFEAEDKVRSGFIKEAKYGFSNKIRSGKQPFP